MIDHFGVGGGRVGLTEVGDHGARGVREGRRAALCPGRGRARRREVGGRRVLGGHPITEEEEEEVAYLQGATADSRLHVEKSICGLDSGVV